MDEKIKKFDFKKVDWSKYQKELDEIYKSFHKLKKNRRLMRILKKYEKKKNKDEKKI